VHLDQLLFDLKYDPSILEIPVPRYFREDDRLPVEMKWAEKVERDEGKKKKKKKKKKAKKKKKGDEEKPPPPPMPLEEKQQMVDKMLDEHLLHHEAEFEVVHDPFTMEMDILSAIRTIQKNERGRQGRDRVLMFLKEKQNKELAN
jgi:hypothetical protein